MNTGGKVIKHLLSQHGPMTTNALAKHIPAYEQLLVSKSHMKKRILNNLENQGVLAKRIYRDASMTKPEWRWELGQQKTMEL